MGERQSGPLGLHLQLQLDSGLFRSFRTTGGLQRLVLPNTLGSPNWASAAAAAYYEVTANTPASSAFARPKVSTAGMRKLSAAEEAFLQRYYDMQVRSRGGISNAIMGLSKDQLAEARVGREKYKFALDVAPKFERMWDAMLEEKADDVVVNVASSYRDARRDEHAWQASIRGYLDSTKDARKATGDPFGKKALNVLFAFANGKKAPAGFSGHTHGIAADLTTTENHQTWSVISKPEHQRGWQKTWLYGWLVDNAADHGFFQLKTETWHWEYHKGKPPRQCYPGDAPLSARQVRAAKKK